MALCAVDPSVESRRGAACAAVGSGVLVAVFLALVGLAMAIYLISVRGSANG
jgi:hypothetical protein